MSKWVKIFFAIIIALIVLVFLLPFLMGVATKAKFQNVIQEISNFSDLNITVTEYHRHWFASDATLIVDLNPETTVPLEAVQLQKFLEKSKLQKVELRAHIFHGPFIFYHKKIQIAQAIIEASVILNDEQNKLLQRALSAPPIISMNMDIKANGRSSIDIDIPPFAYKSSDRNVRWQNIHLGLELSSSLHKINRVIDIPEILLEAPNFKFYINSLKASYQGKKETDNLWIGDNDYSLKSFEFNITDFMTFSVDNFVSQSSFKEQQALVSGNTDISIDSFSVNGNKFNQATAAWSINNLNMFTLAKLKQELDNLNTEQLITKPLSQASHFLSLFRELLNNNAVIEVRQFALHTPWGQASLRGKVLFPKAANKTEADLEFFENAEEEFNLCLEKNLAFNLAQKFLENFSPAKKKVNSYTAAKSLINDLLNAKTIIPEDDTYTMHLVRKNKKLMLNGIPFSLSSNGRL